MALCIFKTFLAIIVQNSIHQHSCVARRGRGLSIKMQNKKNTTF